MLANMIKILFFHSHICYAKIIFIYSFSFPSLKNIIQFKIYNVPHFLNRRNLSFDYFTVKIQLNPEREI